MSDVVLKDANGDQQAYEGVNAVILNTTDGGEAVYREFQADWNQTDSSQPDYIKNKITKVSELENDNGYITTDDIPTVPTKVSELVNDAGYITADDIPEGSGGGTVSSWADLTDKPFETLSMSSEFSFANAESFVTCQILNQLWCKFSNLTPSKNQLSQVTVNVNGDAMVLNQFVTLAESDDIIIVSDGGNYTFGIVYTSGTITADYQGVPVTGTVPEVGIYIALRNDPSNYTMTINVEYQGELILESSIPESIARVSDIPEAPEQVQADWDQTDPTKPDYIKNKPVISADGSASVQPNWNQSDNTQADYIKNRPFYDDNIIYFEYDGASEPLVKLDVSAVMGYEAYACKISNTPLTKEQLLGSTMTMYQRGDFVPVTITEDIMIDGGNYLIINTDSFYSVFEDTTIQGLPVTTGTWTALVPSMFYVSKIEKNELKQIDKKFIPSEVNWCDIQDKPFINESSKEVVLFPETEITYRDGQTMFNVPEEMYSNWYSDWNEATITINGAPYAVNAFEATMDGTTAKCIGNPVLLNLGEDNGTPFFAAVAKVDGEIGCMSVIDTNVIKTSPVVCSLTTIIKTGSLKPEYIPEVPWDKIADKPFYEGEVVLFPEQVVTFDDNGQCMIAVSEEDCKKWMSGWTEATVTINDTIVFTSKALEFGIIDENIKAIGNPVLLGGEDNGQPSIMYMADNVCGIKLAPSISMTSAKVSVKAYVVEKIAPQFVYKSNWDETDENSGEYIKNKPFGMTKGIAADELLLDTKTLHFGIDGGKDYEIHNRGGDYNEFARVLNSSIKETNANLKITLDGQYVSYCANEPMIRNYIQDQSSSGDYSADTPSIYIGSIGLGSILFFYSDKKHDGETEVDHTIKIEKTNTVFPVQKLALANGVCQLSYAMPIVFGRQYQVAFNGQKYEMKPFGIIDWITDAMEAQLICIGNKYLYSGNGEDTGEDFLIIVCKQSQEYYSTAIILRDKNATSCVLDIKVISDIVQTVPEKYLPKLGWDTIGSVYFHEVEVEEQDVSFSEITASGADGLHESAMIPCNRVGVASNTYSVYWDGVKYDCVAKAMGDGMVFLGNMSLFGNMGASENTPDTGEPFVVVISTSELICGIQTFDPSPSHTVKITERVVQSTTPIPEVYLPESVKLPEVTTEDNGKILCVVDGVWKPVTWAEAQAMNN